MLGVSIGTLVGVGVYGVILVAATIQLAVRLYRSFKRG